MQKWLKITQTKQKLAQELYEIGVLEKFTKFTEKQQRWSNFLVKLQKHQYNFQK